MKPTTCRWLYALLLLVAAGTQTGALTIAVTGSSSSSAVNLSGYYNAYGIATVGSVPQSGGFDNDGYGYDSSLIGTSLTYQGLAFPLAGANTLDAVFAQNVALPSGNYTQLLLLGAGVNGAQTNQPIIVTYSDGSTSAFTQSFSDWTIPQNYTGESTVIDMADRITPTGGTQTGTICVYGYTFSLNSSKTVSSVQLPNNRNVVFLAMGLEAIGTEAAIQPSFFAMGVSSTLDRPKVAYGMLAHPPVVWTTVEGAGRGVYNWKNMDSFVQIAPKDANGVAQIDLTLGWTPGWAVANQGGGRCLTTGLGIVACTVPPDNLQDWVDFVTALIQHYNGTKGAAHVKYYEIWNEANNQLFWTGGIPALVNMAALAYPIIKSDPNSHVATPSVFWGANGVGFMTEYLQAGGANYAEILTFHGYPSSTGVGQPKPIPMPESSASTNAPIQTQIATFRAVADDYGMSGKPIASTEGGWGTNGVIESDQQVAWIAHYEIVQAALAPSNNMAFQDWYLWGTAANGKIENSSGQPSPAGDAYVVVLGWLTGQTPQPCTTSGNIWLCQVGKNLILWDSSQACNNGVCTTAPFTPPSGYSQYVDVTNKNYKISGQIALGVTPFMLEP
jgi:hypothetical protein